MGRDQEGRRVEGGVRGYCLRLHLELSKVDHNALDVDEGRERDGVRDRKGEPEVEGGRRRGKRGGYCP